MKASRILRVQIESSAVILAAFALSGCTGAAPSTGSSSASSPAGSAVASITIPATASAPASPSAAAAPTSQRSPESTAVVGMIAFTSKRDGSEQVYVMDPDGSSQTRLTRDHTVDHVSAWAPDRASLLISSHDTGNDDIYVVNVDGSSQKRLTNTPFAASAITNRSAS